MSHTDDKGPLLDQLRELPVEVTLEQVGHMVAAFPLATGLTAWLATLKTNLNTILMTITGTLLVATGIHVFSGGGPATTATTVPPAVMEPRPEAPLPAEPEEAPAVVLAIPAEETAAQSKSAPPAADAPAPADILPPVGPPADPAPTPEPAPPTPVAVQGPPAPDATDRQAKGTNERRFDLRDFIGIKVMNNMDVTLEIGDFAVIATGDEDVLQQLDVQVKEQLLQLDYRIIGRSRRTCGPVDFTVRMPLVHVLEVMGSGSVQAAELPTTSKLDLSVMGSGNITLGRVPDATALNVMVRGSGNIHLKEVGTTGTADLNVVGSGNADVGRIAQAGSLLVRVAGSGTAACAGVNVSGTTTMNVTGSGDLTISGTTSRVEVTVTGSGNVHANELKANGGTVAVTGSGDAFVHSEGPLQLTTKGSGTIHTTGSAGGNAPRGVGEGPY
ncbi:MAG TPA: DUF2807 domain-containing protein [Flavobacteriales bacterium]